MSQRQGEEDWDRTGHIPLGMCPLSQQRCAIFDRKEWTMKKCEKCGSGNMKVGWTCTASGSTVFPWYCEDCNFVFAKYVKKEVAEKLNADPQYGELKLVKTRTQKYFERTGQEINCEVCGLNEGELHHWAPQYLFGSDADLWPMSYLCRACHKKWHDLVTPNMGKMK